MLACEVALFRCRYQAPNGAGPFEVTVTSLADGDGAVVTHRPPLADRPTGGRADRAHRPTPNRRGDDTAAVR